MIFVNRTLKFPSNFRFSPVKPPPYYNAKKPPVVKPTAIIKEINDDNAIPPDPIATTRLQDDSGKNHSYAGILSSILSKM